LEATWGAGSSSGTVVVAVRLAIFYASVLQE
jgi:hypothetical protein